MHRSSICLLCYGVMLGEMLGRCFLTVMSHVMYIARDLLHLHKRNLLPVNVHRTMQMLLFSNGRWSDDRHLALKPRRKGGGTPANVLEWTNAWVD